MTAWKALLLLLKVVSIVSLNQDDGELRFHEHTMIMSHNSAANKDVANGDWLLLFGVDQEGSIYEQLTTNGVRGLSLDIKLDSSDRSKLRLVHNPLDYGDFQTEMQTHLVRFLEEYEEAIVAINFEVVIDDNPSEVRPIILRNLKRIFSELYVNGVPLANLTFKYDSELWANHDEWPTLNEMRLSGQRLVVFHDRSELRSTEYGFIFRGDIMKENFWIGLDDCVARYQWESDSVSFPNSNYAWSRLFFMNHFDSIDGTVGEGLLGGGINGWGSLFPRIQQCMASNGSIKPNFISLDWVVQVAEALEVAQYLNFGGSIGSGQQCLDDSHCATSSCNKVLGVCQCKECDSNLVGSETCLGCEAGQLCAPVDSGLNECFSSAETVSDAPTSMPSAMPVEETSSPTTSNPTASPSDSPSIMPVNASMSPSFASPTTMPTDAKASPTTASPTYSPSVALSTAMPIETTSEPTAAENATTLAPTALTEPQTPKGGIQSQASLANVKENSASTMFKTLSGKKTVLAIGILGQWLLI